VIRDFPLPSGLQERFARQLARTEGAADADPAGAGEFDDVPVRPAATVLLLREGNHEPPGGGLEVFMVRRSAGMVFAAGMHVFPGGAVDEADADPAITWFGPPPQEWAVALAAESGLARALVVAAVRETFEECGVLLAGTSDAHLVEDVSGPGWEQERADVASGRLGLSEVLGRRGLGVRADLLRPWAHWITPPGEPRRFDTRFFVAAAPAGQSPRHVAGEADQSGWVSVAIVLREHAAGRVGLLPPTQVCLEDVATFGSVAPVLATARRPRAVMPRPVRVEDGEVALRVELDGAADDRPPSG
jgi:8-oxo-dGTP pyrophosphatase MutT (NUDIX family)